MSYISAMVDGNSVLIWERIGGKREQHHVPAPYYFYADDPKGKYKTIYDTSVRKIDCGNDRAKFFKERNSYQEQKIKLWESDIGADIRALSTLYYNVPAPKLHITHLDIEVDYDPEIGFSSPKNPYAPINSVALFHHHRNEMVVLAVPPNDGIEWTDELIEAKCNEALAIPTEFTSKFKICKNERELLLLLLDEIEDSDLIDGWNSQRFDFPYIAARIQMTLGEKTLRRLSFLGGEMPRLTEVEIKSKTDKAGTFRQTAMQLDVSGRLLSDYMLLYKKYEAAEKPSYKLEAIADEVLVDDDEQPILPKLHYAGTLHGLYRNDFAFFVRYNVRDVEILRGFEHRLAYVELANQMYHMSCGLFTHVLGTLKLAELAIINYCHHEIKRVVNNVIEPAIDKAIQGALVLLPQIGLHEMIGSIDINSLYPSAIRSLNISPEKIRGQFIECAKACLEIAKGSNTLLTMVLESTGEEIEATAEEWQEFLLLKKWAVSGYGTVFDQDKQGILPAVLTDWFAQRKAYQAKKKAAKTQEEIDYYDRLQYVYKIKLNSLYGALSNLYFRFYDLRMGESTTGTGRMILRHQCRKVNEVLEGKYDIDIPMYETMEDAIEKGHSPEVALNGPIFKGEFQSESVIYGDTDSTYFATWANTVDEAIIIADAVAEKVNESYPDFMRKTFLCQPGFDNIIKAGREVVSDRGIFVDKKRYILHLVDIEGKRVDKCKVMGLDTKKTTLPAHVSKRLNRFIERFLKGEEWSVIAESIVEYKTELENSENLMDIGLPKGVQNVEMYTKNFELDYKTRLPGHVAASIFYNRCLKDYDDKVSQPIMSGMKIKVFYVVGDYGKFKSVAIPTDSECVPDWFLEHFKVDMKKHIERLVDNPLDNILRAIDKKSPTKKSLNFEAAWEF